ncbi:BLOC-2 complex member HPS3-like [Apostichopus japonicus]|uniref:BLOC-2 complex member HPS3-like n=1 Tax=Stichopus japonicus TaxID=307972 RepID=UPI003AB40382
MVLELHKMVLVISCHPFSSQRVINPSKEPVKCIISGEWTFLFTIDCGMEIHKLVNSDWCLQFTIQNEGFVEQAVICRKGSYLASLEKNQFGDFVQVYHDLLDDSRNDSDEPENWRYKLSLDFTPTCIDCCSLSGSLAVGGNECVSIFKLDSEEMTGRATLKASMNIHVSYLNIQLLNIQQNFLAVSSTKEMHVLYVPNMNIRESHRLPKHYREVLEATILPSVAAEEIYYHRKEEIFELHGPSCFAPRTAVLVQSSDRSESEATERTLHLLYKLLSEKETPFHTLQLSPRYYSQDEGQEAAPSVITMHCLVSNKKEGFLFQLYPCVMLQSRYLYTSPCTSVSLDHQFLFATTDHGLVTYTHRAHAAFINQLYLTGRIDEDGPDPMHEVCLVSQKPFYGLQSLCTSGNRVLMMSKIREERKSTSSSENSWSVYILDAANPCDIFDDIVDFSLHSNQMNPETYLQGLIEAHFLLRSEVINKMSLITDEQLKEYFKKSCKLLGEFYAREPNKNHLLTLEYFSLAGITLEEAWRLCFLSRKKSSSSQVETVSASRGFLHYLKNAIFSSKMCGQHISQECLSSVLDIFLKYEPMLCSEVIVAPHLQEKINLKKADEVLAHLRTQVMCGQQYQWKPLDFIAAITVHLRKGEMEQAMATFDLIYEDELVNLCCGREHLVVSKTKKLFTYFAEMMSKFPSAIVSILINLTEVRKMSYLEVCDVIEKSIPEGLGQDVILMQYLEAFITSSSDSCLGFKMVAVEKLLHLYLRHLMLEASSSSSSSEVMKRNPQSTLRTGGKQAKRSSRHSWLDKLPPFEGDDVKICTKQVETTNIHMKRRGLWRFPAGKSPQLDSLTVKKQCHCLQCHSKLVRIQDLLCMEISRDINIHEAMEICLQLPEEKGKLSLQLLCLALTSPLEAVRIILDKSPSILGDFCVCAIREGDLESWKLILQEIKRKENDTRGKDIKIYQQYTNDLLNHLASKLSPLDFKKVLPEDVTSEFSAPFLAKLIEEDKLQSLKEDIVASLENLVNP